jgi:DNA polymerase III subunit beta
MKFTISASEFANAIESVQKFISSKHSMPILSAVKIEATETLKITGFDLSHGLEVTCPAEIIEPGVVAIPISSIATLSKGLRGQLAIECIDSQISISTLSGSFELQGMDASEYPELVSEITGTTHIFDAKKLVAGLKYVQTSASLDETKSLLQGVNIQGSGEVLTLASTDGHRLTVYKMPIDPAVEISSVTVTAKSLALIPKTASETISLTFDDSQCLIDTGDKLITRVFDSKYPDYPLLIPNDFIRTAIVDRVQIIDALSLMMSICDKNNLVCASFRNSELTFKSTSDGVKGRQSIDCDLAGEDLDIGFNLKYLLSGLKIFGCEKVKISMNQLTTPVVLTGVNWDVDLLHLVMPVQIRE